MEREGKTEEFVHSVSTDKLKSEEKVVMMRAML